MADVLPIKIYMANDTKAQAKAQVRIQTTEEAPVLGKLLRGNLPLESDGLPGLVEAPVVYDLILRDLQEEDVRDGIPEGKDRPEEHGQEHGPEEHRPEEQRPSV